ncbi:MAG TPA: hypothetical protein PKD57_09215, partial [Saprospiraceae bacterium]|nr:hypothetical protein [Saprospiraceae bacterium]
RGAGKVMDLKAIDAKGHQFGIKAITPEGQFYDVKGLKMMDKAREMMIGKTEVFAHIKAIPQNIISNKDSIWHIKCIHPSGVMMDVKAIDKDGKLQPVKALAGHERLYMMDVKAKIGGKWLPVKVLSSNDQYSPVKAIGMDGTIYDIKAITAKGDKLDVKAVMQHGNIFDIKAIDAEGKFMGIKAVSPGGLIHDVKGMKMLESKTEGKINNVDIMAHIKALPVVLD